ncbi:hypothetical protein [uncultured Amnibacterium sp.]|uniref:hypothetical protein n=1 Tax=uncultured Amnibacterium sp. TaxID=1631851 RepID=UPI0035CAE582
MSAVRGGLIGIGVVGLLAGAWLLLTTVKPVGLVGLAVWFAVAILLHDAILSPLLFGVGWLLRRTTGRVPLAAIAIVQVAAVVGGIASVLLLPAMHAKQLGTRNPSVLPLDYAANLAGVWGVLVVAAATAVGVVLAGRRRRDRRSRAGGAMSASR